MLGSQGSWLLGRRAKGRECRKHSKAVLPSEDRVFTRLIKVYNSLNLTV